MTDTRNPPRPDQPGTLDRTRSAATDAARRTAETIETNPLGIVVGGLAVGVLAGALLPRSEREKELLAPVGKRLGDTARAAIATARDQGLNELENRGFTRDAAREQVKNLLGGIGAALTSAGSAAAKSATGKGGQSSSENAATGESGTGSLGGGSPAGSGRSDPAAPGAY